MSLSDWIGSVGVGLTLIAYFSMSIKLMSSEGALFYFLNTIGAALSCASSVMINYWPFIVLEGVWSFVSLIAMVRALRK